MRSYTWIIIIVLAAILAGAWYWQTKEERAAPSQTAVSTPAPSTPTSPSTRTTSDGMISFATPSDFALATTPEQVLVKSYIPPCEEQFSYCLYYKGSDYQGTNFESAGLSIVKRSDLASEQRCLQTPPQGYDASMQPNNTASTNNYSTSVFENVGDAGAGHYASGALYRLYIRSSATCYEFLLRIGETQFANYPAGSIKEFTDADRATVGQELTALLYSITVANGSRIAFPDTK